MKRGVVLLAILLMAPRVAANPAGMGPKDFVAGLYAAYGQPNAPSPLGKRAGAIFSPSLLAKIRADQIAHPGEVGKLDHDPFCDCQDSAGLKPLGITVNRLPHDRFDATVRFRLGDARKSVHLRMVGTSSGWKVDDVSSATMPSLQGFLPKP